MTEEPIKISLKAGTLRLTGNDATLSKLCEHLDLNENEIPAASYRDVITALRATSCPYQDTAMQYQRLDFSLQKSIQARPHQAAALSAWEQAGYRGIANLPTGAGKTILAVLAISRIRRSTLIVVPTLELVRQWNLVLSVYFATDVGQLGGGEHRVTELTVATYDSAMIYRDDISARFGFVVFDECHHLPATSYRQIARALIAPFRLGLSATLERSDGEEEVLDELIGPVVYADRVASLVRNDILSTYDTKVVTVELNQEERERYDELQGVFSSFITRNKLSIGPNWQAFIQRAVRLPGGRAALAAFRERKQIYQNAAAKLDVLWTIMSNHADDRMLIFTDNNAQAYHLGRNLMVPVISHLTKQQERSYYLSAFAEGKLRVLVTSKVLNEGVDVPEANVAVVVSGSGTVREHVQRLGRILRHSPGKKACLYELITADTAEANVAQRRRRHDAYR